MSESMDDQALLRILKSEASDAGTYYESEMAKIQADLEIRRAEIDSKERIAAALPASERKLVEQAFVRIGGTGGALTPLAIAGLLALGGTKGGQKAINAALFKRPAALKSPATRRRLGKLQGLFGAASVPLMLESGN